ncbi:hypothetical protein BQ1740_2596 [Bacillus subtilis]|nr:hypothetical protein BQ1740_2596 [Bacillus subtilis]
MRSISVTLSNIENDVNQQLSLLEADNEKRRILDSLWMGLEANMDQKRFR